MEEKCFKKTLGCTSAVLSSDADKKDIVFISDGRFHMEGAMIANPHHNFYQYNPYEQKFTFEEYDFTKMIAVRKSQMALIKKSEKKLNVAVILGVLGRQGNQHILGVK